MPVTFLQQCDHALGNATWDGSLGEPMVEHIRQNGHKRVAASSTLRSPGDLLRPTCFNASFSNHTLAASRFGHPKAGKVGKIAAKLLKREIRTAGKVITKVHPKGITYLAIRSQHVPIRRLDRIDIPIGKSSQFFLTRRCVGFHSFVENSF